MENNRYREEEKLEKEDLKKEDEPVKSETNTEEVESFESKKEKKSKIKELMKANAELGKANEELQAKIDELQTEFLKNRAELENFKRRTNEERIKERKYALQDFFHELINVLDIYDKAVNVTTDDEKLQKFLMGFNMINIQLKQILESYGVVKIEALNKPFDSAFHSAVDTVEKEGVESGIVVEELIAGYMYKDRVLRPSMVKVSK